MSLVTALHFPSQETIVAHLERHPQTSDLYLREKKIIDTVASYFAHTNKRVDIGVELGVLLAIDWVVLRENITLSSAALDTMHTSLTAALKDCATFRLRLLPRVLK